MRDTQCLHGYVRTAQSVCTVNFKQFGFKTQHCAIQWFGCGRGRVRVRGRVSIRLPNARKGQTCTWTQSMQIGEWQQAHMQPAQLMEQTSRSRKREVNIQTCLPELVANVSRSSFNLQTSRSITWLTSRVSWVRVQSASTLSFKFLQNINPRRSSFQSGSKQLRPFTQHVSVFLS